MSDAEGEGAKPTFVALEAKSRKLKAAYEHMDHPMDLRSASTTLSWISSTRTSCQLGKLSAQLAWQSVGVIRSISALQSFSPSPKRRWHLTRKISSGELDVSSHTSLESFSYGDGFKAQKHLTKKLQSTMRQTGQLEKVVAVPPLTSNWASGLRFWGVRCLPSLAKGRPYWGPWSLPNYWSLLGGPGPLQGT